MKRFTIKIETHTTAPSLDRVLEGIYREKTRVQLNWDLTELTFLDLKNIMLISPVLERHRENTKKYLINSNIIISQPIFRFILEKGLPMLRPEKPVYIISPEEVEEHSPEYPQLPESQYPLPYPSLEDYPPDEW